VNARLYLFLVVLWVDRQEWR